MVFPGVALIASFLSILFGDALIRQPAPVAEASVKREPPSSRKERRRKSRQDASGEPRARSREQALVHFVLPAAAIGGFISMLPQRLIELEPGYLGPPSLVAILEGLVRYSSIHSATGFAGLAAWFPAETGIWIITRLVTPAFLAGLAIVAILIAATWRGKRSFDALPVIDRFLLLVTGMLPVAIVMIVLSRYVFQQPYPELRTAMYWIPLLSLACLSVLRRLAEETGIQRIFTMPLAAIVVACVVQYATQFNIRYFAEWAYCAAGKDMMQIVRAEHALKPGTRVRAGATWQLEPVINFYRVSWGLSWLDPVFRESPDNSFDYYLLASRDTSLVERRQLQTLLRDRLSGTVLAKPANR
jgi:hypothetical protein